MRAITQPKPIKQKIINLEPVQIDVQLTQKTHALSHRFEYHSKSNLDIKVAQSYDNILNSIIEQLLGLTQNNQQTLQALSELITIKKQKISFIAVLNLQFVQKLTYIHDKCQEKKIDIHFQFIREQIKYWTSFIQYSLIEKSQQIERYGPIPKKQPRYIEPINKDYQKIQSQDVQQVDSKSDSLEQKQPIKISKAPRRAQKVEQIQYEIIKPSKIPRIRFTDRTKNADNNGGNENYFGNIDS